MRYLVVVHGLNAPPAQLRVTEPFELGGVDVAVRGAVPVAAPGLHLVGLGRVVVAVPDDWSVDKTACGRPEAETIRLLPLEQSCRDIDTYGYTSSLHVSSVASAGAVAVDLAQTDTTVNGIDVLRGPPPCPPNARCAYPDAVLVVPSEDVVIVANGDVAVAALESLAILPEGYTTVPFVGPGVRVDDAQRRLEAAGLAVELRARDCGPTDLCQLDVTTGADPASGSVVAAGSTVTLEYFG